MAERVETPMTNRALIVRIPSGEVLCRLDRPLYSDERVVAACTSFGALLAARRLLGGV